MPNDVEASGASFIESDPLIGQRCGDYLLVALIGAGGFGRVYKALQVEGSRFTGFSNEVSLGMPAAVKVLPAETGRSGMAALKLSQFEAEVEALARLSHPNIVRLYQYGQNRGVPFLAMELVEGAKNLRAEIEQRATEHRQFTLDEVEHILMQVLDALEAAHERQIVHRDIKPENIMLQAVPGQGPRVKVLDFGQAKFVEDRSATSLLLGTPAYMAFEQLTRGPLGPWTDLYALGVLSFELLTGKRPYGGAGVQGMLALKLDTSYDPWSRLVDAGFPEEFRVFVARTLTIDSEARYANARAMRAGLQQALEALRKNGDLAGGIPLARLVETNALPQNPSARLGALSIVPPPTMLGVELGSNVGEAAPGPSSAEPVRPATTPELAPRSRRREENAPRMVAATRPAAPRPISTSAAGALPLVAPRSSGRVRPPTSVAALLAKRADAELRTTRPWWTKSLRYGVAALLVIGSTLAFIPPAESPSHPQVAALLAAGPDLEMAPNDQRGQADPTRPSRTSTAARVGPTAIARDEGLAARDQHDEEARREAGARAKQIGEARIAFMSNVSAQIVADTNIRLIADANAKLAADAEKRLAAETTARVQAEAKARAEALAKERARNGWSSEMEADAAKAKVEVPAVATPESPNVLYRALLVTVPDGADVYVNSTLLGKSPITVHWQAGSVSHVSVKLAGHDDAGFDLTDKQSAKLLKLELVRRESKIASPL